MQGKELKIDPEELPKVLKAIISGNPAICKQGIFNPSSYVSILEDKDREVDREVDEFHHYTGKVKLKPLVNIFEGVDLSTVHKQLT